MTYMTVPNVKSKLQVEEFNRYEVTDGKEKVKKAAKFLDKVAPGWFTKVDLLKFDMTDSSECVLGQVFGNYSSARDSLTYNTLLDHLFQGHTCEWREEIKKRIKNLKGE